MYKKDLALNDLQWLIGHQTKPGRRHQYYNTQSVGLRTC